MLGASYQALEYGHTACASSHAICLTYNDMACELQSEVMLRRSYRELSNSNLGMIDHFFFFFLSVQWTISHMLLLR